MLGGVPMPRSQLVADRQMILPGPALVVAGGFCAQAAVAHSIPAPISTLFRPASLNTLIRVDLSMLSEETLATAYRESRLTRGRREGAAAILARQIAAAFDHVGPPGIWHGRGHRPVGTQRIEHSDSHRHGGTRLAGAADRSAERMGVFVPGDGGGIQRRRHRGR